MKDLREKQISKLTKILKYENYAHNTIECYINYVTKFLYEVEVPTSHINGKVIQVYLLNYKYSSISQQNQIVSALKKYAKNILGIKYIDKVFLQRPRKSHTLPKIIDSGKAIKDLNQIQNLKHKAILSLALSSGLRVGEIIRLRISDIDSKRMVVNIIKSKRNKSRIAPLSSATLETLRTYYIKYKPTTFLFNGQKKIKYSYASCRAICKKYMSTNMHVLRHTCATHLIDSGASLRAVQGLLGHANSKTTEIYTHVSPNTFKKLDLLC